MCKVTSASFHLTTAYMHFTLNKLHISLYKNIVSTVASQIKSGPEFGPKMKQTCATATNRYAKNVQNHTETQYSRTVWDYLSKR